LSGGGAGNVELVSRAFDTFDREGLEPVLPFIAEDVAIHSLPDWPDDSEYRGHDGFRKLTAAWTEHFDGFGFDVEEIRGAGEEVAVRLRLKGQAKVSGMPLADEIGAVFAFGDDRVREIRYLPTWEDALAAAGLSTDR